jgi:hypothetical protein
MLIKVCRRNSSLGKIAQLNAKSRVILRGGSLLKIKRGMEKEEKKEREKERKLRPYSVSYDVLLRT